MIYRILFCLIILIKVCPLIGQTKGFFINLPFDDSIKHSIKYHIKLKDNLIYILNKNDLRLGSENESGSYLIKRSYQGDIISQTDLGNDTLKSLCAYGENLGEDIQTFCFATNEDKLYLIYRLYNQDLEEKVNNVFYVDTANSNTYYALTNYFEKYRATNGNDKIFIVLSRYSGSYVQSNGMVFNNSGEIEVFKSLDKKLGVYESNDVFIYNPVSDRLNYIHNKTKYIFDDSFNFIKQEYLGQTFPIVNDTACSLFCSILEHNGKRIRLAKTALTYNEDDPDEYYGILGRGISEIDYNMRVKGKITMTPLPMSDESDGVARYSSSLFYHDDHYYTIFEYQDYNLPLPSPTTFYITKFDTLFDIVEETHFVINDDYRFFIEWVDFSDQLQFSASGFYYRTENGKVIDGDYILAFNLDGSQPPLGVRRDVIKAVVRVRGNPTSDYLNLSVDNTKDYSVRIYDLGGNLLMTNKNWIGKDISIPVHKLSPGAYIYQIVDDHQALITGKFVKI